MSHSKTDNIGPAPVIESPFGIAWGQVYGLKHRLVAQKAEEFMPQLRELGATAARINFYWNQIEPVHGQYEWDAVDTFIAQLTQADEAWVALATSSLWATRTSSDLIPSSPAKDQGQYYDFVRAVVERCKGRVQYWQMEFEVGGPFWSGNAKEYVKQLKIFARAIKDADPNAKVVLAGFLDDAYDTEIALTSSQKKTFSFKYILFDAMSFILKRQRLGFYNYLLHHASDLFDVLDLHLYQDAYTIPASIIYFRQKMADYGYEHPIFIGEYNGPSLVGFPENMQHMPQVMNAMRSLSESLKASSAEKIDKHAWAEQKAMKTLYDEMAALPAQTQMFMEECPLELEAKRDRINCREIVMRNLFALSAGARKTFCFNLAPDLAGRPYQVLNLMFNKYRLMDYENGVLKKYLPAAESFRRMTSSLADMESVRRVEVPDRPAIYLFEVIRHQRPPMFVVWEQRDAFAGEDQPPTSFDWPWPHTQAHAVDTLGAIVPTQIIHGLLHLPLSLTPIFVTPNRA